METEIIEITESTNIVTIFGADSYFGAHFVKYLSTTNKMIYGYSQKSDFDFCLTPMLTHGRENIEFEAAPIVSDWIIVCVDPSIGLETYIQRLKNFCDYLIEQEFFGRICFISLGGICYPSYQKITEETMVFPRTEYDLGLSIGENMLNVMQHNKKCLSSTHIMRVGVPYGDETCVTVASGFVNKIIKDAIDSKTFKIAKPADSKRTLTHVEDICKAIMQLMAMEYCPMLVNISGETMAICDVANAVAKHYNAEIVYKYCENDEQDFYAGDQELSAELFNKSITFKPKYTFSKWLDEQNC